MKSTCLEDWHLPCAFSDVVSERRRLTHDHLQLPGVRPPDGLERRHAGMDQRRRVGHPDPLELLGDVLRVLPDRRRQALGQHRHVLGRLVGVAPSGGGGVRLPHQLSQTLDDPLAHRKQPRAWG